MTASLLLMFRRCCCCVPVVVEPAEGTPPAHLIHSLETLVYIQFQDGGQTYHLGDCTVLPTLPNPATGKRAVFSKTGSLNYQQIGIESSEPSATNLNITTFVTGAANYLERVKESGCPFNIYVLTSFCGAAQAFNSYERAWVYRGCEFTDDPVENVRENESDKLLTHVFNVTAWNGRIDHRFPTIARVPTIRTASLLSVAICPPHCATDCGPALEACEQIAMGAASTGGGIPNVHTTTDGGQVIAVTASSFPTTTNILALSCINTPDGIKTVMARDGVAGLAAGIESALWDTAWVDSIVGETPSEGVLKDSAMFFLDYRHGWICTDEGRVYFSKDAGLTWNEQVDAYTASGGNALRAIHFADALIGYAAGIADTVIATTNGGETWASIPSGLGEAWLALYVFDHQRLIVGSYSIAGSGGNVFMSYDAGANWLDVTRWIVVTGVTVGWDIHFLADGLTGYLLKNDASDDGTVYKSINGGYDWRPLETPANVWIQSIEICQPNSGFVVGNTHNGTSFIAEICG